MVKVKFCGLRRKGDIKIANSLGIDYMGFILYPKSPRFVGFEELEVLIPLVEKAKKVAVFVNPSYEEVKRALDAGIDLVQLHGEEGIDFARKIGMHRVIKAFRVKDKVDVPEEWKEAYGVLLDTYSEKAYGGTGKTFNWEVAKHVVSKGFRVFLSGGLNAENVKEAIKEVMPYCVDVSSGIEKEPGVKEASKMEAFVRAIYTYFSD